MPTSLRFCLVASLLAAISFSAVARAEAGEGGTIEGAVRRQEDLAPVDGGTVGAYLMGSLKATAPVVNGHYSLTGLEEGSYLVIVHDHGDRVGMLYPNVACMISPFQLGFPCPLATAQTVPVALGSTVTGIDFEVLKGAALEGNVTLTATGLPPAEATLRLYNAPFSLPLREQQLAGSGGPGFRFEGLGAGTYYLWVSSPGLTPQWYSLRNCPFESFCFGLSQAISVDLGQTRGGIDYSLDGLGSVSGRVIDEVTGQGIENVEVGLSAQGSSGPIQAQALTDANGDYRLENAPAMASVMVVRHANYRGEYFDNVPEETGIGAARGFYVRAGENTSGIDFALVRSSRILARLVDAETGEPLAGPCFATPLRVGQIPAHPGSRLCNADGTLEIPGLAPGDYYLMISGVPGRARYVYGKGSCNQPAGEPSCDLTGAALIQVRSGVDSGPYDMALEKSARLAGRVNFADNQQNQAPIANIEVYDAAGRLLTESGVTAVFHDSFEFVDLAAGKYYLVVDGHGVWPSLAWPDGACNRWYCDPLRGTPFELAAGDNSEANEITLRPIAPYTGCEASDTVICLNQGRYRVEAFWHDFGGASGKATARSLSSETGYFYFFSSDNVEVLVKALNACDPRLGHRFWIYGAGLTNVQVELRVEDTLSGEINLYSNALGNTFQPILDSNAFDTCDVAPEADLYGPAPGPPQAITSALVESAPSPLEGCQQLGTSELCLGGRFVVTAQWTNYTGGSGFGGQRLVTADTGVFSFFSLDNIELVVKVLDACNTETPGFWLFASGLTDVQVELKVRDTVTGKEKIYQSPAGPFVPILDFGSFSCN